MAFLTNNRYLGLLVVSYLIDVITTLSLSAVSSNGEVKSGGTYYLISRSLGPEFGGSIGLLFYLAQVLNTALNIVGLLSVLKLNFEQTFPHGYWWTYLLQTIALVVVTALSLAGSGIFAKASNALLIILGAAILSIPISALFREPFEDPSLDVNFTGLSLATLESNLWPHTEGRHFSGVQVFRDLFGILFPATSGLSSTFTSNSATSKAEYSPRYLRRCLHVRRSKITQQIHSRWHAMGHIDDLHSLSTRHTFDGC